MCRDNKLHPRKSAG
ncbi:hypothetical protein Pint_04186 [Pistacia integerrima]|uniref:Uncharacterized protein n=1 Tax=Pistacia integerrima TaxID=434235 RepID=A0ACC0Z412_9ROSI|nr:hypothetical protein Pint_04186 [Pistacia integerrima]